MQVERLEEGFDLSGPEIPRRHYETRRRVSNYNIIRDNGVNARH